LGFCLIREGDKFDDSKWLQRVREGEARAKQGPTTFISEGLVAAEIGDQTGYIGWYLAEHQADDQSRVDFESASAKYIVHPKAKHQKSALGTG
jgi:hypothetical protein